MCQQKNFLLESFFEIVFKSWNDIKEVMKNELMT